MTQRHSLCVCLTNSSGLIVSDIQEYKTCLLQLHLQLNICKYNTSVDNTTLYLYIKIVYFVRVTCFDLIRSSSGPPRSRSKSCLCFNALWNPTMQWNIQQLLDLLLGGPEVETLTMSYLCFIALLDPTMQWNIQQLLDLLWTLTKSCSCFNALWDPTGSHNAMKHTTTLGSASWRAWRWPYKIETCRPHKIYYFCI